MKTANPDPSDPHDAVMLAREATRKAKRAEKLKAWEEANPGKVRSYWDSEKGRAVRDSYYYSERGTEIRKQGQARNAEKVRERNRLRAQTPEAKAKQRAYVDTYYTSPKRRIHHAIYVAKNRAKLDGLEFDSKIFEELEGNIPTHCPCCGDEIQYIKTKRGPKNPSLDRIDNTKGYISENVCVICFQCNLLKSDGHIRDFENILTYMKTRISQENW
jgi:hypothetical protein